MSIKRRGLGSADKSRRAEIASMGGSASTNRPFKDPAAATRAANARWALTRASMHDNNQEMGGPDKGKAGTAPSPNDKGGLSEDGQ